MAIPLNNLAVVDTGVKAENVRWVCNPWGRCWWRPNSMARILLCTAAILAKALSSLAWLVVGSPLYQSGRETFDVVVSA